MFLLPSPSVGLSSPSDSPNSQRSRLGITAVYLKGLLRNTYDTSGKKTQLAVHFFFVTLSHLPSNMQPSSVASLFGPLLPPVEATEDLHGAGSLLVTVTLLCHVVQALCIRGAES